MGRNQMTDIYNTAMAQRIVARAYGLITWEGEIVELVLPLDGIDYTRSMDTEAWQNKVKARYAAGETAYSETTGSSDIYGESVYIDVLGGTADATSAAGRRDRRLTENAYPRSRPSGGFAFGAGGQPRRNQLRITAAGYVFSMNRRYQELDLAAAAISSQISTLVGNSEFVTAGRIDSNATTKAVSVTGIPMRLWNLIEELIEDGDSSGNQYAGGVYGGRKFNYNLAETAVTHFWRDGKLLDLAGVPVHPALVRPDIIVRISNAPFGTLSPGAAVKDDTKNAYINAVEFIAPNGYRLLTSATTSKKGPLEPDARSTRVRISQFTEFRDNDQLTSTDWDGDSYSTTAKTKIDLSAVFSAPAGIRKALFKITINDSASAANECWIALSPTDTAGEGLFMRCSGIANDKLASGSLVVPCDANGDVYYQTLASGASTLDISLEIWGYWI
jgi:hypothetical protein